jgi:hypothetical protein
MNGMLETGSIKRIKIWFFMLSLAAKIYMKVVLFVPAFDCRGLWAVTSLEGFSPSQEHSRDSVKKTFFYIAKKPLCSWLIIYFIQRDKLLIFANPIYVECFLIQLFNANIVECRKTWLQVSFHFIVSEPSFRRIGDSNRFGVRRSNYMAR